MRQTLASLFIISILLTACSAQPPAPEIASPVVPSQPASTQPATIVSGNTPAAGSSPTPFPSATPSPTSTPAPIPLNLGSGNFNQFVQIQTYRQTLETTVGKNIYDFRLDAIAYSPDGRYLAMGGCTGNWNGGCINTAWGGHSFLYILDARTAGIVSTLPETEVTISGLAFSTDGKNLVYATNHPDRIVIWDVASAKVGKVLWQSNTNSYRRLAISPDGSRIADVDSNTLRVWDANSGKVLTQKPGGNYGDKLPRFSVDGSRLAVFSKDSGLEITIYDTATWAPVTVISLPYVYPGPVAISPDFKRFATAEGVGNVDVLLWDGQTGLQVGALHDPLLEGIDSVAFTPDGQLLLVSGTTITDAPYNIPFSVWDVATRQNLGRMFGPEFSYGRVNFSADGTTFTTGGTLWSLPDAPVLAVRVALGDFISALNRGDYASAAAVYQPYEGDVTYFHSQGVSTTDLPALLKYVCSMASQPCMPLREILYAGKESLGGYGVLVTLTAPDGSVYKDADGFDNFWFYADINPDGRVIFTNLPPFPMTP